MPGMGMRSQNLSPFPCVSKHTDEKHTSAYNVSCRVSSNLNSLKILKHNLSPSQLLVEQEPLCLGLGPNIWKGHHAEQPAHVVVAAVSLEIRGTDQID